MRLTLGRRVVGSLLFVLQLALATAKCAASDSDCTFANAEARVRAFMREAGLREGYDSKRKRVVVVGTAEKEMDSLVGGAGFDIIRSRLAKTAILDAKKGLVTLFGVELAGNDVSADVTEGELLARINQSVMKSFASQDVRGCHILRTAESWNAQDHCYQVAVVMGWSESTNAKAVKAMSDLANLNAVDVDDDDPDWQAWFAANDLVAMVGSRRFVDGKGRSRYVGIGFSDIEGLSGSALKSAVRKAKMDAVGHLAFSLQSDLVAKTVASRYLKEMKGMGRSERLSWESFVSEVMSKCSMPVLSHEVYSEVKTLPVTGRKTYVSVYGIVVE